MHGRFSSLRKIVRYYRVPGMETEKEETHRHQSGISWYQRVPKEESTNASYFTVSERYTGTVHSLHRKRGVACKATLCSATPWCFFFFQLPTARPPSGLCSVLSLRRENFTSTFEVGPRKNHPRRTKKKQEKKKQKKQNIALELEEPEERRAPSSSHA